MRLLPWLLRIPASTVPAIAELTTPDYAKNTSYITSVTVSRQEALIESNMQGNHYEESLSMAVHMVSDYLEHRNVSEEAAQRISHHVKHASIKAPQHFAPAQLDLLPRIMRKDVMKHLVTEQVSLVSTLLPDSLWCSSTSFAHICILMPSAWSVVVS